MTAELMGPRPDGFDPLSPSCVAALVTYLASPLARHVTGEVFVVHGGVVAALAPPALRLVERSDAPMWTVKELDRKLGRHFAEPAVPGFVSEATLPLADSTFGEAS